MATTVTALSRCAQGEARGPHGHVPQGSWRGGIQVGGDGRDHVGLARLPTGPPHDPAGAVHHEHGGRTPDVERAHRVQVPLGVHLQVAYRGQHGDHLGQHPAGGPARRAERRGELHQGHRRGPRVDPEAGQRPGVGAGPAGGEPVKRRRDVADPAGATPPGQPEGGRADQHEHHRHRSGHVRPNLAGRLNHSPLPPVSVHLRELPRLAAVAALALLVAACGSSNNSGGTGATTAPGTTAAPTSTAGGGGEAEIDIQGFQYTVPASISPGATVKVVNKDSPVHSVTSGKDRSLFDSDVEGNGTSTFTAPTTAGTYDIICKYHSSMHGTLVVK